MRYPVFLMALLAMAACSSPEERAQLEAQKEIAECTQAGYQPDTPAFDDCRLQVRSKEEQKTADRIKAATDIPSLQPNHLDSTLPSGVSIPLP